MRLDILEIDALEDVQGASDNRQPAIDKVGIKNIRHPVKVQDKSGQIQHTVAASNLYVQLITQHLLNWRAPDE